MPQLPQPSCCQPRKHICPRGTPWQTLELQDPQYSVDGEFVAKIAELTAESLSVHGIASIGFAIDMAVVAAWLTGAASEDFPSTNAAVDTSEAKATNTIDLI